MIILNILVLLAEALYFYIPLKEVKNIKSNKNKIILYMGLLFINIIANLIFKSSMFKYIFSFICIYIMLKFIERNYKNNTFYDFFIIPILFFIKAILEYSVFLISFKHVNYITFIIILELTSLIFMFAFKRIYSKIYNKVKVYWSGSKKFYHRYITLLIFNILILFILYNLIKIKEVL